MTVSYSGKVTRQGVGGTWFKPRNHSNQVVLISFVKKLFIVCLIEHHSLNFMRTNNENGYKYTNFPCGVQQVGTVSYSGKATRQGVGGAWDPRFNHNKWFGQHQPAYIFCGKIVYCVSD